MGENSNIEWTDHTFNPWRGCVEVHAGCDHCYARELSKRNPAALGQWGESELGGGVRVVAAESHWRAPVKWNREAEAAGVRARVFCASLADVFEDWRGPMCDSHGCALWVHDCEPDPEPDRWAPMPNEGDRALLAIERENLKNGMYRALALADVRRRLFDLIDRTPHLDWILVTKRPENIPRMWCSHVNTDGRPPSKLKRKNVWLLTSASDQATADKQIPELLRCRDLAPVLGISAEPLLGAIHLTGMLPRRSSFGRAAGMKLLDGLDWAIVGGESGHHARPMHPDWVRSIRDQCVAAGVPFFFKQWGEFAPSPDG